MKKLLYHIIFLCALVLFSCQDNDLLAPNDVPQPPTEKNNYSISADSALAYLADFLENSEIGSRNASHLNIKSVTPIKFNRIASRAEQDSIDCENVVYIANFKNEDGYAILAADTRISDKVIAIVDSGNLTDATVYTALELAKQDRYIFEGYPTTGPGFITTPETGDEVFMNPNTVVLYDENIGDTLVGTFLTDDIGAEDENGNRITLDSDDNTIALLSSSLCVTYAMDDITDPKNQYKHVFDRNDNLIVGDAGGVLPPTRTEKSYSSWRIKQRVYPILTRYSSWNQYSPFNDFYPKKRELIFIGRRRRAPAGCFPLAIAKLITHFETVDNYTYNGITVDWYELKYNTYSSGRESAAALLKGLSVNCDSWYFYNGTFTFPHKATACMRNLGLKNAHTYRYSWERVLTMLDAGLPLIAYSVPGIKIWESHSWNIDGYKVKERTVTYKTYIGETLDHETTQIERSNMVHCDFGWNGTANGYYASGVFTNKDPYAEYDYGTNNEEFDYRGYLHVIMYEK